MDDPLDEAACTGEEFINLPAALRVARRRLTWAVLGYGLLGIAAFTFVRSYAPGSVPWACDPRVFDWSAMPGYLLGMLVLQVPLLCGFSVWFRRHSVMAGTPTLLAIAAAVLGGMALHAMLPALLAQYLAATSSAGSWYQAIEEAEKLWPGLTLHRRGPLAEGLSYAAVALPLWIVAVRLRAAPIPPVRRLLSPSGMIRRRQAIALACGLLFVAQFASHEMWGPDSRPSQIACLLPRRSMSGPLYVIHSEFSERQRVVAERVLRRRFPDVRVQWEAPPSEGVLLMLSWREVGSGLFWHASITQYLEGKPYYRPEHSESWVTTYVWILGLWVHVWTTYHYSD